MTPVPGNAKTIVETAIIACREKDGELLGALVAGGASETELETLLSAGRDVQLLSMTIPSGESDAVSITVGLSIQYEGGTEQVERTWELANQDGVWRFTTLPNCF